MVIVEIVHNTGFDEIRTVPGVILNILIQLVRVLLRREENPASDDSASRLDRPVMMDMTSLGAI